jgi:hypothetical protein
MPDVANKAEALASYAKMADDDTLRQLADGIQARAVRRMGELLKEYDGKGNNQHKAATLPTQKEAADAAGISEHQTKQAVRVANVPAVEFDAAVEGDNPATVTALAAMGTKVRAVPEGFKQATHLIGSVKRFAECCQENEPGSVAGGVLPHEVAELQSLVSIIDAWLDRFIVNLQAARSSLGKLSEGATAGDSVVKMKADRAEAKSKASGAQVLI